MDSAIAHVEEFLQNSEEIMRDLNRDLESWKKDKYNREIIDRIFRYMHSLKSGAAFLQLDSLELTAHKLESLFDSFRKGAESENISIDTIIRAVRHMGRELEKLSEEVHPVQIELQESSVEPSPWQSAGPGVNARFSPFELQLLEEASLRGEKLYRIICHLDEFPQMIYARAYLLMNNLELNVNVITTSPSMKDRNADFTRFTAYITTDLDENHIYRAVNVDSVVRVDLIRLDYSSYLENSDDVINLNFDDREEHPSGSWIRVEQRRIDEIAGYIDQLKIATGRFTSYRTKMDDLHAMAKGMEKVLLNVTLVPLNNIFRGYSRFVSELCRKTGKQAELRFGGESCTVDRSVFDVLGESLQHLIRNAVYHGIENPSERADSGKRGAGLIEIRTEKDDDQIVLTIRDDGRGISKDFMEQEVESGSPNRGLSDEDLLALISRPGFSTVKDADNLSGRGVGLDLVIHNIHDKLKGQIEMFNTPGQGLEYRISIPSSRVLTKILMIRNGNRTIAFPSRNVESSAPLEQEKLRENSDGLLSYMCDEDELPVFTESGKLHQHKELVTGKYVLIVRYLGLKAAIFADDLLMEKEIVSENMRLLDEKEPYLYKAFVSGREYLYLSPSIIST